MKLVDANVLLYAVNESSAQHEAARSWLDRALSEREAIAFAWVVLLAFLRVSTRAGVFPEPLAVAESATVVDLWLAQPPAVVVQPHARHLSLLRGLLAAAGTGANLVNDAHLAALALEHDAEIVSFDRDFQRFAGLRVHIPPT